MATAHHTTHHAVTKPAANDRDDLERRRHDRVNAVWTWLTLLAIFALVVVLTVLGGSSSTSDSYYFLP